MGVINDSLCNLFGVQNQNTAMGSQSQYANTITGMCTLGNSGYSYAGGGGSSGLSISSPTTDYPVGTLLSISPSPKPSLMKTIITDIKTFINEHRTVIYSIVAILLVDHFFLGNKLTARIKAMAEKMLGVVEKKVDAVAGTHMTTVNVAAPAAPVS